MFVIKCLVRLAAALSIVYMVEMFMRGDINQSMLITEIAMIAIWVSSKISWKKKGK